jgi:SPP1 gp7 family putative phage head morphogenesis protein
MSLPPPKYRATRIDAERERIVRAAVRQSAGLQARLRADVLRAWRSGAGPSGVVRAIRSGFTALEPVIRETMLAAHLAGEVGSVRDANRAGGLRLDRPIDTAVDYFAKRLGLTPPRLADIMGRYGQAAASVTGDAATMLETKVIKALAENTLAGGHISAGTEAIRQAFDAAGVVPKHDYQIESILRTQTAIAYSAGQRVRDEDPAIQEILWGYQYVTVGDDRVRPEHAAMDGHTAAKDDPIWDSWTPPCGWGCRCALVKVYHGEPEAVSSGPPEPVEIDGVLVTPGPDAGWGFNPADLYRGIITIGA